MPHEFGMSARMDTSVAPPPWSIETHGGEESAHLRIGQRLLPLRDVSACEASSTSEINFDGHMIAVGLFMAAGALFVLSVVFFGLGAHFLAGGILFILIGLTAFFDILDGRGLVVHRVRIRLTDGRVAVFSSPHARECQKLVAALDGRLIR